MSALASLSNDLVATAERVGRSVVAIHARRRIPASGVVWRPHVVVAANHTLARSEDITVTLPDGGSASAVLAGRDPTTDLAVLRLESDTPPAARASEEGLRVGSVVLALGRPGPSLTASMGIVSAVAGEWRTWHGGAIDRFVRLDLAIYDGFSGGPLAGPDGGVLGINTSGLARAVALTLPARTVDRVTDQLLASGRVRRGYLGLAAQPVRIPERLRQRLGLKGGTGLVIVNVEPAGPADGAGLLLGDVLVALDGEAVADPSDLLAALGPERVGRTLSLRVIRAGEPRDLEVTVGERPAGDGQ